MQHLRRTIDAEHSGGGPSFSQCSRQITRSAAQIDDEVSFFPLHPAEQIKERATAEIKAGATFDHVGKDQQVKQGDLLVTAGWKAAGLTSIYPPGIPIGRVTSVGQNEVDLYKHVQLQPFVNFKTLSSLVVLFPPKNR